MILLALVAPMSPAPAQATGTGGASGANAAYSAVIEGMSCRQQATGRMDCEYAVGESLRFVISGVGQEDAVIQFTRVDSAGGFVAGFAALHGCIVVKSASDSTAAPAYISPRDGKVYRVWQHCRQQPRR